MSSPEFLKNVGIHAKLWFPWQQNNFVLEFYIAQTGWQVFKLFCWNVPWITLYQIPSSHVDWSKNMAAYIGGGLLWLKWKLKKSSPTKVSDRFSNNLIEMFQRWPTIRFLKALLIGPKTWPPQGEAILLFCLIWLQWTNLFLQKLPSWLVEKHGCHWGVLPCMVKVEN